MKKFIVFTTAAFMMLFSACSGSVLENAGKELEDTIENAASADNKYVLMVRGGYRENNPDLTYEKAFSAFFDAPRWKYFESDEGEDIVEFTGDCTYQEAAVKARIQFKVDEENGTFEAVYLAFNEVPQDALTLNALIEKTFTEEESDSEKTADTETLSDDTPSVSSDETETSGVLSKEEALAMVQNWNAEHRLGDCQTQDAEYAEDSSDGRYKYNVICNGNASEIFIYVNPQNGAMSVEEYDSYYDSIDYWYRTVYLEEELEMQYDEDGNEVYYAKISYGYLQRYTDNYIGQTVVVKPLEISQVLNYDDAVYVSGHEASYDDYAGWLPDYNKEYIIDVTNIDVKILEGDVIDVYGSFAGLQTMTSAIGNIQSDYPLITADKVLFEDAVE